MQTHFHARCRSQAETPTAKVKCPTCRAAMRVSHPRTYKYRESGLNHIVLHGGVLKAVCPNGHGSLVSVQHEEQLLQVIALWLLVQPGLLRGNEIKYLRNSCGLTQDELAKRLSKRRPTITEWESQTVPRHDAAWDYVLRGVFLVAFSEALLRPGNNHLGKGHRKILEQFKTGFVEVLKQLHARRVAKVLPFEIRKTDWQLPGVEAA